jgi:hypothetical protein
MVSFASLPNPNLRSQFVTSSSMFFRIKLKRKVLREPLRVPFDCLKQRLNLDAIEFRKVRIQHSPSGLE